MYYIYERSSTFIMGKMNRRTGLVRPDATKSYKTISAAKTALTKMSKRYRADLLETVNDPLYRYGIASHAYFYSTLEKNNANKALTGKQS